MDGNLGEYRKKYAEWVEWLNGEDVHTVRNQVLWLNQDTATIKVVLHAAQIAVNDESGHLAINPSVYDAMLRWYTVAVCSGIRRLNERFEQSAKRKEREVYSLRRVLCDMKANAHLLTRENLFALYRERWAARDLTGDPLRILSVDAESCLDKMCRVESEDRRPTDRISEGLLDVMLSRLNTTCEQVSKYADKYVAHAASPASREKLADYRPKYRDVWEAVEIVTRLTGLLVQLLCLESRGTNLHKSCGDIAKPWVSEDDVPKLEKTVQDYETGVRSWEMWSTDWLLER